MSVRCRRPVAGKAMQQGAALIVTALLMLVISLLALVALRRSNLDERMAFNQRDRQVALQAAEAAIRAGEEQIRDQFGLALDESFFIGKDDCGAADYGGWCRPTSPQQSWSSLSWANGNPPNTRTLASGEELKGVSSQPRYLIEYKGAIPQGGGDLCVARFLITARGFGLNNNSNVTLQTVYQIRIGLCQLGVW